MTPKYNKTLYNTYMQVCRACIMPSPTSPTQHRRTSVLDAITCRAQKRRGSIGDRVLPCAKSPLG